VFSRQNRKSRFLYSLADFALTSVAFFAAYVVRLQLPLGRTFELSAERTVLLILVSATAFISAGLWLATYDRLSSLTSPQVLLRTAPQVFAGALAIVVFEYVIRLDLSRPFLALFLIFVFLSFTFYRIAFAPFIRRARQSTPLSVLVVGTGDRAERMGRLLEANGGDGVDLIGFLDDLPGTLQLDSAYPVYALAELSRLLDKHIVDEVIFAVSGERLRELEELFLLCDEEGVRTRVTFDIFPHAPGRAFLDRLADTPLLTFGGEPHYEIRLLIKRALDFLLASSALILLSPFLLLIVILIKLTSKGPALFGQERCGWNGRRFTLYKFRTMVADAESRKAELEHLNVKRTAFKIPNDPRVTPLGRWLRKYSIDEAPQLWNILRGEMSIVGPRPAVPREVEQYERWQRRRLRMRPGLTCLWTLAGRDALDFDEWMRLDLAYIDRWSLSLDWNIILRTVPHVLTGKGAH
jgi:exopolysaccharide biosynthesis polyprenyl glycosylphosphotransferase